jgi:phage replication O-like protein O
MKNGNNIQIENGEFSRIHNEILTALAVARFTGSEYRCLLFLLRKTYGWRKKEDAISLSQWAEGVGTDKRQNVLRTLQGLVKKGVVHVIDNGANQTQTWGFNKYIEQWDAELFPESVISQDNTSVISQDNTSVISQDNTSVISQDNTSVISQDNTSVISQDNNKRNIKENKRKLPAVGGGAEKTNGKAPNKDPNFGTICTAYEQNIGLLTSNIGESIEGMLYEDNIPAEWVIDAIRIACEQEKRNLAYVRAICRRWKQEGRTHNVENLSTRKPGPVTVYNQYTGKMEQVMV